MNKQELIDAIANEAEVSKTVAGNCLEAFINTVTKTLKKGGDIRLIGFGTFSTIKTKAREGRNPKTGEKIQISATTQAKFKVGKALKDALN